MTSSDRSDIDRSHSTDQGPPTGPHRQQAHQMSVPHRDRIDELIRFWFGEVKSHNDKIAIDSQRWYRGGKELDDLIREKFEADYERLLNDKELQKQWRGDPDGLVALILLFDQFSRNMYRGTAKGNISEDICSDRTQHSRRIHWLQKYA